MYGEVYSFEPEALSRFIVKGKLSSVLDFAFQSTLQQALVEQKGTDVLAKLFAKDHFYQTDHQGTDLENIGNTNVNQLVNFTGNHDMGRFAYNLKESKHNYSEDEQIKRNLLAHALLFFSRGVPVIYYGDEQGFVGDGGDQASRQDMMPSQVASYNNDDLLATDNTTADDNFDTSHLFYQSFAKYAELYQEYPALRFGKQSTVYAQDKPGVFAIKRTHSFSLNAQDKEQELLIVFNTANRVEPLNVLDNRQNAKLLYVSGDSQSEDKIAPLSFAIYQLK